MSSAPAAAGGATVPRIPMSTEMVSSSTQPEPESLVHAQARIAHYRTVLRRAGYEIERRLACLDFLAAAVGEATEPTGVLGEALNAALDMLEADTGAILVIEDEHLPPTLGAQHGLSGGLEALLTGRAFESAVLLLPQVLAGQLIMLGAGDDHGTPAELRQLLADLGLSWLVSLPLNSGGKLLGALFLGGARPAVVTPQDRHWVGLIGQQAALALESVRLRKQMWSLAESLFGQEDREITPSARVSSEPSEDLEALLEAMMAAEDEVQHFNQDLAALNRLAEELGQSLKPDTVMRLAVTELARLLGLGKAWLYLLEEDQPYLCLRAHVGLSSRYLQRRARLGVDENPVAELLAGGDQVLQVDTQGGDAGDLVVEAEGLRATCVAPLRAGERVVGLLGGARGEAYAWTARDARLLRAIAAQASLALHNALLYEKVRDAAQAQAASNELLQGLNMDLLDSQAAQEYQLEELGRQAAALQAVTAHTAELREQVNGLMQAVRALCSPAAGTLTLAQQLQVQALVRGLTTLSSGVETLGDPSAIP